MSYITYPEEQGVIVDLETFNTNNVVADVMDCRDLTIKGEGNADHPKFDVFNGTSPIILDDQKIGMSVISAICSAIYFNEQKAGIDAMPRSRLFAYYNERANQNRYYEDVQCSIKRCIQNINQYGLCPESMHPYDTQRLVVKPSVACFEVAKNHRKLTYSRVGRKILAIKTVLAEKRVIIASIKVPKTGISADITLPFTGEHGGGYCILICGWNDAAHKFTFVNSMGASWGRNGLGTIQYEFLLDPELTMDMWVIE